MSPLNRFGLAILLGLQLVPQQDEWYRQLLYLLVAAIGFFCLCSTPRPPAPPPPDPLKILGVVITPE